MTTTTSFAADAVRPREVAASRDDPEAFEAAVRPHYANLVRRLVLVLGNEHDAEDIAQDAYLKAFQAWRRFDGSDVRAWLYTIALRLAFNHLRGRRRWLAALQRVEFRQPSASGAKRKTMSPEMRPPSATTNGSAQGRAKPVIGRPPSPAGDGGV